MLPCRELSERMNVSSCKWKAEAHEEIDWSEVNVIRSAEKLEKATWLVVDLFGCRRSFSRPSTQLYSDMADAEAPEAGPSVMKKRPREENGQSSFALCLHSFAQSCCRPHRHSRHPGRSSRGRLG